MGDPLKCRARQLKNLKLRLQRTKATEHPVVEAFVRAQAEAEMLKQEELAEAAARALMEVSYRSLRYTLVRKLHIRTLSCLLPQPVKAGGSIHIEGRENRFRAEYFCVHVHLHVVWKVTE